MIKAVILDIDGVLIHREQSFSQRIGVPLDTVMPFFDTTFQDCLIDKADLKVELAKHMQDWGWTGTVDDLLKFWFEGEQNIDERMVEYITNLRLKGLRVIASTNNERYRVAYLIDTLHIDRLFDTVYASCTVGYKKPDAEFFEHIFQDQGLNKDEAILWDDDKGNIKGAQECGIRAEHYTSFADFAEKMKKVLK